MNDCRLTAASMTSWCSMAVKTSGVGYAAEDQSTSGTVTATMPLWRDPLFWLTIGLSIFAIAPFLQPGYFWGANDARHHVYFLFEYDRVVQDGIWWPRWSPDFAFGYGYPFFNIYGLLSHFLAEVLHHFFGLGFVAAIEAVFVISIVGSAATMYAFIRSWMGRHAAVIAGVAYVYVPYHLLNLYVRANLAESMAFVWMPLCLLAVRQSVIRPSFFWVAMTAFSYAGLLLTSNLVFVLFTPLLGFYLLLLVFAYITPDGTVDLNLPWTARFWPWIRRGLAPVIGLAAGIGLGAVFLIPMVLERQYVRQDQWFDGRYDFHGNFVYFFQLFSPQWGFGTSRPGPNDPIGYQIGVAALVLAVLGVMLVWPRVVRQRWEIACFCIAGLVATFAGLQWAGGLWDLPLIGTVLQFAQFPWRWFSITALCVSILAGLIGHRVLVGDDRHDLNLPLFTVIAVLILSSYPMLQVQIEEPAEGPVGLAALMRFQRSADELTGSTAWVKEIPTWSPMAEYYVRTDEAGDTVLPVETTLDYSVFDYNTFAAESVAHNTVMEEVQYFNETETDRTLVFNQFYYPGWNAYLLDGRNGKPVETLPIIPEETGTLGRMTVSVPPGQGYMLLRYEDTPPRTIGRAISLLTLAALAIVGFVLAIRNRRN